MNPFKRLGLERGADETQVKQAYARALKVTRPDDDPVAFQALNEAYRAALAQVRRHGAGEAVVVRERATPVHPVDPPVPAAPHPVQEPAPVFNFDVFLCELRARDVPVRVGGLSGWLHSIGALYDLQLKQQVGDHLHGLLLRMPVEQLPPRDHVQELSTFFGFPVDLRLAGRLRARDAIAREDTTPYGEPRPLAIRTLKRPFRWPRALLLAAMPGLAARIARLGARVIHDACEFPRGMDEQQYRWFALLASPTYLGKTRWISIAVSALLWGTAAAGVHALLASMDLSWDSTPLAFAIVSGSIAALLTSIAVVRWLRALMNDRRDGERYALWLPVGCAAIAMLWSWALPHAAGFGFLVAVLAQFLAVRHPGLSFTAIRYSLGGFILAMGLLGNRDGVSIPAFGMAMGAAMITAVDFAYARHHAMGLNSAQGNPWTRIGSWVALFGLVIAGAWLT